MGGTGPGRVEIGEIGEESAGETGNKGNRVFDPDGVGGTGSERECILVGDPAT
jgi:hypothetical protein